MLAIGALSVAFAGNVMADEFPLVGGNYWEVAGIYVKDGGNYTYAKFLAGEWRKNQEFSKSKGWIKSYMILANVNPRSGEPTIYLITVFDSVVSGAEGERRNKEYEAYAKKTGEAMEAESGNRAQIREVKSDILLQELTFR